MKMTNQEKAIKLWEWLTDNPGKGKVTAYDALDFEETDLLCPACDEAERTRNMVGEHYPLCNYCPMLDSWIVNGTDDFTKYCDGPGSAYKAWSNTRSAKYAALVLKSITDGWSNTK